MFVISNIMSVIESFFDGEEKTATDYKYIVDSKDKAIYSLELELQTAAHNYEESKDPNYLERRRSRLIEDKLSRLKAERTSVFDKLRQIYNNNTDYQDNANKYTARNAHVKQYQTDKLMNNRDKLTSINSDIMTMNRQVQINTYMFNRYGSYTSYLRVLFIATLFCLVFAILSKNNILVDKKLLKLLIIGFYILAISLIMIKYVYDFRRSKFDWQILKFPMDKDMLGKPSTCPPQNDGTDGNDNTPHNVQIQDPSSFTPVY
jgi:hypothetical protein